MRRIPYENATLIKLGGVLAYHDSVKRIPANICDDFSFFFPSWLAEVDYFFLV